MNTEMLAHYRDHMRGEHRYTRLSYEEALASAKARKVARQLFEAAQKLRSPAHVKAAATRKANMRARDPLLSARLPTP